MSEDPDLLSRLKGLAQTQPDVACFHWIEDNAEVSTVLTYKDIDRRSDAVCAYLNGLDDCASGDRILLVYPPGLDFIIAFIGCVKGGYIAVPAYPPDPNKLDKDMDMFNVIQKSCAARIALTNTSYDHATKLAAIKNLVENNQVRWPTVNWITTDSMISTSQEIELLPFEEDRVAFLQYTSGSTSNPKGVIVSHGNLKHNLRMIIKGLDAGTDTVVVSWLPQYHDMGLIGSYLGAIYCGGCGYYMVSH
jgi:acyl-CoA synthetase (AMP-forming)/AMP-acid ligase II